MSAVTTDQPPFAPNVPRCLLERPVDIPQRAAFPVVDAHNHLWGNHDLKPLIACLDEVGVVAYCDLTANAELKWAEGGYTIAPGDIDSFFSSTDRDFPNRFYGFTMAGFANPAHKPLFRDAAEFVSTCCATLRQHVSAGARGLKITKELGLGFHDAAGNRLFIDDPRFTPIWDTAEELNIPILAHQSDPIGFFEPVTPDNEHYESMRKYPTWSFAAPEFPRKLDLLQRRDTLIRSRPRNTFILPHVANYPENLAAVSALLDECPNVIIDLSARIDELGRQPYAARDFLIRYAERVLFGTDMPASPAMYRCYFRFLETRDEYFFPPDYDGTFSYRRWPIYGLGLPRPVLKNLYHENAMRIIPGLKEQLAGRLSL